MLILLEEHLKTLIQGFYERNEGFTLRTEIISPEGLDLVGWGVFIKAGNLDARLRYVYKDRSKALAKISDLLPNRQTIIITTA